MVQKESLMVKFHKNIKEIQDNSDFFDIDYDDLLQNFDTNDTDEKVKLNMQFSLVNIAFVDAIRGDITRPKFIDRILTIYRNEWINDLRYRTETEEEMTENNNKDNIQ